MTQPLSILSSDKPQTDPENDLFNYAPFAKQLAYAIENMTPVDGLVLAVYGDWGTGKSTLMNFVEYHLNGDDSEKEVVVMKFNPWWYSGQGSLLNVFFHQLAITLETRLQRFSQAGKNIANLLVDLSIELSPVPESIGKRRGHNKTINQVKIDLQNRLSNLDYHILIVIDDIDRLHPDEIRQLFTVIKAVADLPNIIYILAFDSNVVIDALEDLGIKDGMTYLEKIVQVPFRLPQPDENDLLRLLVEKLNVIINDLPSSLFNEERGYLTDIKSMIKSPRDVYRFVNTLSVTYPIVRGEVNVADFIAIEALRVFHPKVYALVQELKNDLLDKGAERTFQSDSKLPEYCLELLKKLFPQVVLLQGSYTQHWRQELRICTRVFFDIYFVLSIPDYHVSMLFVRELVNMETSESINERIRILKHSHPQKVNSLLNTIYDQMNNFSEEKILSLLKSLFEIGDDLLYLSPNNQEIFDPNKQAIINLIFKLLKSIYENRRVEILSQLIDTGQSYIVMINVLIGIEHSFGKYGYPNETSVKLRLVKREYDLKQLEKIILRKIHLFTNLQNFWTINPKDIRTALHMWHYLAPHELEDFIEIIINDSTKIMNLMESIVTPHPIEVDTLTIDPNIWEYIDIDKLTLKLNQLFKDEETLSDARTMAEYYLTIIERIEDR